MTSLRTTLVGVTTASLLAVPAAATALTPVGLSSSAASTTTSTTSEPATTTRATNATRQQSAAALQAAAARHNTAIRFLRFDHVRAWAHRVHVRGQVVAWVNGRRGALQGVRVVLYRKLDGRSRWVRLESRRTSQEQRPKFRFHVRAKANASYRVGFPGNARFQHSRDRTHVLVHRNFGARLRDGSGRFHGRVRPHYAHKVIHLEKRWCGSCGWDRIRSKRTGDLGRFRFKVGAPNTGRWWWRVSVPGSRLYIRSISGVFTTEKR